MIQHTKASIPTTLILSIIFFSSSTARDTITPNNPLTDNQTLISSAGYFAIGFFNPPNSNNRFIGLWYNKIPDPEKVWVANRANPLVNSTGTLSITKDGNLIITNQTLGIVWSSNTTAKLSNPIAKLLDNGNLVVTEAGDESNYAWQGFDHPTDTLIAGMKVGVDLARGINRTITAWASPSDPSPGNYHAYMDINGDPEIFFVEGTTRLWRTGPWDGTHLSGIPDMSTYKGLGFDFLNNKSEVSYSYHVDNPSLVTKLLINSTGYVQRALWLSDSNAWNYFWTVPREQCDQIGMCGNYGLCDMNDSPVCNCLQGFVPKNPTNWNLRDGKDGCVREHVLDCVNGTDGFAVVSNVKVPQSENCRVDLSLGLDQCKELCLRNCSCTAYASADISDGSGCVVWFGNLFDIRNYANGGQDLYVRLAAVDVPNDGKSNGGVIAAITVSLVVIVLLAICVGCFIWRRKKKKRERMLGAMISVHEKSKCEQSGELFDLPIYDLETIIAATDYFSTNNKLGEGGFGPVYKGKLGKDQEIAVKRLSKTSIQGSEEFKNEVILIAKLQHRNLVRLLGCCIHEEERMLIYEYMPNKSLDAFLFEKGKSSLLDWNRRYKIIVGVARGLLYLHQDSRFRIIHRDLKASNILLDKEMDPKISDFGMARLFGGDETDFNTRKVVGTYGYMSPEYAMDGVFSVKSDVFSFGVLILEIISGKKNRGVYAIPPHINLVSHAWSLWKEGKSMQLVDESMSYSFPTDEVLRCIKLGLLCVQEQPEYRPLMSAVVQMLGSEVTTLPQPKQPGFAARRGPFEVETSSSNHDSSCTYHEISDTMFEPR